MPRPLSYRDVEVIALARRQTGEREAPAGAYAEPMEHGRVLRVRGIAVTDAERERILTEKDPARLERWLEKAAVAAAIAEVLEELR